MNNRAKHRRYLRDLDQAAARQRIIPTGSIVMLHNRRRFQITKEGIVLGCCIAIAFAALVWVAAILTA